MTAGSAIADATTPVPEEFTLVDGTTVSLRLPPPGPCPSFFVVGLHKAGSTLFNRIMQPIAGEAGAAFYALPNQLFALGVPTSRFGPEINRLFVPRGYAYGGFRGIEAPIVLPLFARNRTVMLVRDPRDMLTSLYFSQAFSHVPPGTVAGTALADAFAARRRAALEQGIDRFVLGRSKALLGSYRATLAQVDASMGRIWRYEDVVFAKQAWIAAVLDHLGIVVDRARAEACVADQDILPAMEDGSRHIRRVTPGDHRGKLAAPTIARLNRRWAEVLERFGYR